MTAGDNWVVECKEDTWRRDDAIRLRHKDTDMYVRWQAPCHKLLAMNGLFETPRQGLFDCVRVELLLRYDPQLFIGIYIVLAMYMDGPLLVKKRLAPFTRRIN